MRLFGTTIGVWELLLILVVVLLIFGPRRLPEMAKGIGQSIREFRKGMREMKGEIESELKKEDGAEKVKAEPVASEKQEVRS